MDKKMIRLQATGWFPGTLVSDLKVGDVLRWNWGYTSTITKITPKGKQSVVITTVGKESDGPFDRTMRLTRYVVRVEPKP